MPAKPAAVFVMAMLPAMAFAVWQPVATEQGKRIEVDRDSIAAGPNSSVTARGRIVLDKPIVDPKTSAAYRIIEIENRFDCSGRTYATLRRAYFKDEGDLLRQEDIRSPIDMPVRSGTPDDRMLREVCRPRSGTPASASVDKTLERVNELAEDIRKANEELIEKSVRKEAKRQAATPVSSNAKPAERQASVKLVSSGRHNGAAKTESMALAAPVPQQAQVANWSYEGSNGPEYWGGLRSEYAVCAAGRRQSPIDLRDGLAVDLEPIQFLYRPEAFRVIDAPRQLQLAVQGGGMMLQGKQYHLSLVQFHNPSEFAINGRGFEMEAQLIHKSSDGKLAIVSVLLEKGTENAMVQSALNNLPLERGGEILATQGIDINQLLPSDRRYFTFMGSLTAPPCTEGVLWVVFKQAQQISAEQLSIFQRLYPPNARPLQPSFGRIIKESR